MYNKDLNTRYRLETYDPKVKKHICPACEHRTFVRYIDVESGEYVSTDVGRCDREKKCGYHKRPRDHFAETGGAPKKEYYFPKKSLNRSHSPDTFSIVSKQLVQQTLSHYEQNNLVRYFLGRFGKAETQRVLSLYQVGTARYWNGATIFWQQDKDGRFRSGKIMLYDRETGHRVKQPQSKITWAHNMPGFKDFHLNQCLFGEHRIPASTGPVCIVESEKTAMIASIYFPNATFVATGGLQNMQPEKMRCLVGREIILFPDLDATEHWKKKRDTIPCLHDAKVSTWLEKNSTSEEKHRGLDLADFLVRLPAGRKLKLEEFL